MPIIILKLGRDIDKYAIWSTSVDGPLVIMDRSETKQWIMKQYYYAENTACIMINKIDSTGSSSDYGSWKTAHIQIGESIIDDDGFWQVKREDLATLLEDPVKNRNLLIRYL